MKFYSVFFILLYISQAALSQTSDQWSTVFELSNYEETPDYNQTISYFKALDNACENAKLLEFGISPQGRKLFYLVAGNDIEFTSDFAVKTDKPIILIMSGIHSGEINGKDASMLLLREMLITKEKENLLENVILLVIPIFNVDGHERISPYNRINQIGPKEMGWRTTAQNINLNRDFMKADAPEMESFLKLFSEWLPDFFIDIHSTDGSDFQYHTTFAIEKHENVPSVLSFWVRNIFNPFMTKRVTEKGFLISPFVGFIDDDPKNGIRDWVPLPRFSNGYAAIQNRPGLLIESHILKSYKDRVFSTKAILEAVLELLNQQHGELKEISKQSDDETIHKYIYEAKPYPVTFKLTDHKDEFLFKGIEYDSVYNSAAGGAIRIYTDKKFEKTVPYFNHAVGDKYITLPKYYIIPREWVELVDRLKLHGVVVNRFLKNEQVIVEQYKFSEVHFPGNSFEGRFMPTFKYEIVVDSIVANKGDYLVPLNQRTLGIITHLLEPGANDSFVRWGFLNSIFERKEYYEDYAMGPIAEKMLRENPKLNEEFQKLLSEDEEFRNSQRRRLDYFYERSPYFDEKYNLYPIYRVIGEN